MQIKHPEYFGQLLHKQGFRVWTLYMFRAIEGRKFTEEDLHKGLFEAFQDIYDFKENRQSINVPPRSGKTTLARYFVAYCVAANSSSNFIYTSFSQDLLNDISRELAAVLQNPIFEAMYGSNSKEESFESKPIDDFWKEYLRETQGKAVYTARKIITKGGGVILFASIGSTITGFGAGVRGSKVFSGCLFVDDANKPADINSQLMRMKVVKYYEETLLSRLNDSAVAIVNIQQRLHIDDLSGKLAKAYNFKTLKRSLIVDGVCQLPSQYNKERIEELQKNESMFSAQYQQEPMIEGGNLFKKDVIRELPRSAMAKESDYLFRFVTGDLSYKDKQSNDYQCFAYWGVRREFINGLSRDHLDLIDAKRKKLNAVDVDSWITPWIQSKITYGFRHIWIEDKSHGIYLNQSYRRRGLPVPDEKTIKDMLPRDTDKVMRANNVIPCLDNLNPNLTFCIDIENYVEIKEEVLSFPSARHDDFVDNLIDAIKIGLFRKQISILDVL